MFSTTLLEEAATASLYPQKVAASLLSVVGMACVLLAAIGLYSVVSYSVNQRTRELGIRIALGARPGDVLKMVVREGLALTLPGLLVGLLVALAASWFVADMLVEMHPADPVSFGAAAAFLGLVALLASYVPALRATRVDPQTALRCE